MVCTTCEKKLTKVACPEKWREGKEKAGESSGRKINENKLLTKAKRFSPYGQSKCTVCKSPLHQGGMFCTACAYSKGVCHLCGKQIIDTTSYKQTNR